MCGADATTISAPDVVTGSSPRVRSRPICLSVGPSNRRIISACAEQTTWPRKCPPRRQDHLRVCGADTTTIPQDAGCMGSSPRVRSRQSGDLAHLVAVRIISACAEQTVYALLAIASAAPLGSSPRVRSRRPYILLDWETVGIISACAEQTGKSGHGPTPSRDHLRVCGADCITNSRGVVSTGSSPRVRSRPCVGVREEYAGGIISACAEQTPTETERPTDGADHLRVCGADDNLDPSSLFNVGSSPRVRSRPGVLPRHGERPGIISACAEQTPLLACVGDSWRDHLRVCGADYVVPSAANR